jgi:hypothetical protein
VAVTARSQAKLRSRLGGDRSDEDGTRGRPWHRTAVQEIGDLAQCDLCIPGDTPDAHQEADRADKALPGIVAKVDQHFVRVGDLASRHLLEPVLLLGHQVNCRSPVSSWREQLLCPRLARLRRCWSGRCQLVLTHMRSSSGVASATDDIDYHKLRLTVLEELRAQGVVARVAAIGVRDAVRDAINLGASWNDVGLALGITRQAAHKRFAAIVDQPPDPEEN